jgi:hypothetical protein
VDQVSLGAQGFCIVPDRDAERRCGKGYFSGHAPTVGSRVTVTVEQHGDSEIWVLDPR